MTCATRDDTIRARFGKKADLFVLNTLRPYLVPAGRIVSAVIHSGHPPDIESVMIDGRFVMRDNKVLTMDEDRIIKEADTIGRRIWTGVLEAGPLKVPRLPRPADAPRSTCAAIRAAAG